jgi:hypothetical protein
MALTDLEKAYDTVPTETVCREMKNIATNPILIEATINLYKKNTTRKK